MGKNRHPIIYLSHASLEVPGWLTGLKYITSIRELSGYFAKIKNDYRPRFPLTPVQEVVKNNLYYHLDGVVNAVRLFGSDGECLPENRVQIDYQHVPFETTLGLESIKEEWLEKKRLEAINRNAPFFNGPNTRLITWRASPVDDSRVALEQNTLHLTLGPVGWYDYEGLNEAFRVRLGIEPLISLYEAYIGLSRLTEGDVTGSLLSNILDTASSVLTKDGYLGYQLRKRVAALPGHLTSTVAENINRYLDDSSLSDSSSLINSTEIEGSIGAVYGENYRPKGVPHPFAAVRRGITEELSPDILLEIQRGDIKLVGLSFDLGGLHPDALFIILVNLAKDDIVEICRRKPGKDWHEGQLSFAKLDFEDPDTRSALMDKWAPGGQAAFVRAIELVEATKRRLRSDFPTAFEFLRRTS